MNSHQSTFTRRAFSLIEVLTVLSIISIIAGFSVPAISGITRSRSLDTGARLMAGWLNVARSEAISRHTLVRFAVARDWPGKSEANLRKVSLWAWDTELDAFFPITPWQELPLGVAMETSLPDYLKHGAYATDDRSSIKGDFVLEENFAAKAEFDARTGDDFVRARFVEFTAAGSARLPGGTARQAMFVLTPGVAQSNGDFTRTTNANGHAANWAQINIDTFTGRVRVYQP